VGVERGGGVGDGAILGCEAGATALNLDQAMAFARRIQSQGGRRLGEIAFIGTGRIAEREPGAANGDIRNVRVIAIPDSPENCGLRKVGLRRWKAQAATWAGSISAHNHA